MDVFGFNVSDVPPRGDDWQPVVEVDLGQEDGKVVISKGRHDLIVAASVSADDYRTRVLRTKADALQEWQRDSGPDSEAGRNMEAGTPKTEHGE